MASSCGDGELTRAAIIADLSWIVHEILSPPVTFSS
jgi:hypothetical protein